MSVQQARRIRNLAMVGFMGTGKTTISHILASMLDFRMVDTDQLIEDRVGKRITEIFSEEGEAGFRAYERRIVAEFENQRRLVIATGGGLILDPANLASLKGHSLVVCLWASVETIWHRVGHQSHRPLLNTADPKETIRTLLTQREPFYRQADVLINTERRSLREVAQQVEHQFHLAQKAHVHA